MAIATCDGPRAMVVKNTRSPGARSSAPTGSPSSVLAPGVARQRDPEPSEHELGKPAAVEAVGRRSAVAIRHAAERERGVHERVATRQPGRRPVRQRRLGQRGLFRRRLANRWIGDRRTRRCVRLRHRKRTRHGSGRGAGAARDRGEQCAQRHSPGAQSPPFSRAHPHSQDPAGLG